MAAWYLADESVSLAAALLMVAAQFVPGARSVENLKALTGGASYETWAFEIRTTAGSLPLILRRMPVRAVTLSYSSGPEMEANLIILAGAAGVPVPCVRYILAESDGLGRGFICDYVAGESLGRRIVRDAAFADVRPGLAARCGEILARIHSLPAPPLPSLLAVPQLESLYATYRSLNTRSAVFELAFRWLRRNVPYCSIQPRLVHGDFRNGNLIIGADGVRAVLDWELAHIGDPAEDLGWITVNSWRFGEIDKPVGGFGSIESLLEGYRRAGGEPISPERVRYWQAMGSLRWGVMCGKLSRQPAADEPLSVERAMIGRRVSEAQIDLLSLIAEGGKDE